MGDFKSYLSSLHSASAKRLVTITIIVTNTNIKTSTTFVTIFSYQRYEKVAKLLHLVYLVICPSGGTQTYENMDTTFTTKENSNSNKLIQNQNRANQWPNNVYIYSEINTSTKSTNIFTDLQKRFEFLRNILMAFKI